MLAQVILILALLLILVGMIMVLLDAFNESVFWGILVLIFPPFFVPLYSFSKWTRSQARDGFAMALVGLVMVGVAVYGGALQSIPFLGDNKIVNNLPTASPKDDPLPNEEAAAQVKLEDEEGYDPVLSTDKDRFTSKEIDPLAPEEDNTITNFGIENSRAVNVPLENISPSVGASIEVTFKNGEKHIGRLVKITEDSISIEQQVGGGMVSYEYTLDKIQSIVRFTNPSKTTTPPVVESSE